MRTKPSTLFASVSFVFLATAVHGAVAERSGASSLTAPYETHGNGQRLFVRQGCYQCHGLVGQGSILSGPSLAPLRLDDVGFRSYVRYPKGGMPAYSKHVLSDADLAEIQDYVRSIPPVRPYRSIPVLAALVPAMSVQPAVSARAAEAGPTGEALYGRNCAGCHGASLEGGAGPSLKDQGRKRSVAAIAQLIANPPPGMPKLFPSPLSKLQVDQVAGFVAAER